MKGPSHITVRARFLTEPSTAIAVAVAHENLHAALDGIAGATLDQAVEREGLQLDLTLNAENSDILAEALDRAGPHIGLLSQSAHLAALDITGPVSDEIRAALQGFSPVYD
ncbi:MAG: hypothetical protein HC814_03330 [Rhodobacteraceae bacterium]|nr:hypothetical protein [Paracoccaceae bacterium]